MSALFKLLRCPRCGCRLSLLDAELRCDRGHAYPIVDGVPYVAVDSWADERSSNVVRRTSEAFGLQWTARADAAEVGRADLLLHLPARWDPTIFAGAVLDLGCGMGRYTELVAAEGASVIGLDVSVAVGVASSRSPAADFVRADIIAPPFATGSFDLVYSFGVLHHLPDPGRGFRKAFELVRPGGRLLVWVYSAHGGVLRAGRRVARRVVARAPALLRPLCLVGALAIWLSVIAPGRLFGFRKLNFYRDKRFRELLTDCHDALAAPTEVYLDEEECRSWLTSIEAHEKGFERRSDGSGWILWAIR